PHFPRPPPRVPHFSHNSSACPSGTTNIDFDSPMSSCFHQMYSHLSTMSTPDTDFRMTTLNMLPAEASGGNIEAQKDFIRRRIVNVLDDILVKDKEVMNLVEEMGSDLSIS